MPINWRTDYGIRLLYELARLPAGTRATVRDLSEAADVPYDYARTIVRDLVVAGLLESRRGVGGGVQLAGPAADLTVLDVFRALDEPVSLALCTDAGGVCGRTSTCPMHVSIWSELDDITERYLGGVSFQRIVDIGSTLPATVEDCL
jgi:Rrf2 family protein